MNFSAQNRPLLFQKATAQKADLLVIGGGITGAGIALDAAMKGLSVVLIEKNDFASGTSSRSTKLIHGGVRYLKQFEFKLVKDVGSERAVVYKNALHIVRPERMLLPIIKNGSLGQNSSSLGLWIYDFLAGVKKNERREMLNKEKTLTYEPLLNHDKLTGGGVYFEYRTDDARLVIELLKTAHQEGAISLNYCEATTFVYDTNGKIKAVEVLDKINNKTFILETEYVVNATGPGVDVIRKKDNSLYGKRLQLTKGIHLVFSKEKMPLKQAAYFDVFDGRMMFAIPRGEITYVGTTDTIYNQEIDKPLVSKEDVNYTIKAINEMFPTLNITPSDIQSSWAGLRPLIHEEGKGPSELSRKDEIMVSESGLISIAGGKLTGYRLMAEKIVTLVVAGLKKQINRSISTKQKALSGSFESETALLDFIKTNTAKSDLPIEKWATRYGTNTTQIIDKANSTSNDALAAEIDYCIENEMALKLTDFVVRRSGMLYFELPTLLNKLDFIATHFQLRLNWSMDEKNAQLAQVQQLIKEATTFE